MKIAREMGRSMTGRLRFQGRQQFSAVSFEKSADELGRVQGSFARWLVEFSEKNGEEVSFDKVRLAKFPAMGHGLTAAHPLQAGEVVFEVPHALWFPFSAAYAKDVADSRAPQFIARLKTIQEHLAKWGVDMAPDLEKHVVLGLHILFEYADNKSFLQPYLRMIPERLNTPLFWNGSQRLELKGTKAAKALSDTEQFFKAVHGAIFGQGDISYTLFVWSLSIILSRAVSGGRSSQFPYSLVPLFDLLNHSLQPTCDHVYDPIRQTFVLTTRQPHNKGDQLLISYGNLPNEKLLRLYGFTIPDNPYEECEVIPRFPKVSEGDLMFATKLKLLQDCVLGEASVLQISQSSENNNAAQVLQRLRVIHLLPQDFEDGKCLQDLGSTPESLDYFSPISVRNEVAATGTLLQFLEEKMESYPTTLQEDKDQLVVASVHPESIPSWKLSAIDCRVGEKLVLRQAIEDVRKIKAYWMEKKT